MAIELLDLGVLLLVKQFDDDAFIPVLWLHWYDVDCECAFSANIGTMVKATNITKAIPNIFEILILFMQFQENTSAFELFIKGLVCKFI